MRAIRRDETATEKQRQTPDRKADQRLEGRSETEGKGRGWEAEYSAVGVKRKERLGKL